MQRRHVGESRDNRSTDGAGTRCTIQSWCRNAAIVALIIAGVGVLQRGTAAASELDEPSPAGQESDAASSDLASKEAAHSSDPVLSLPRNLWVQDALRPVAQRLLAASPTFRSQCARLADARGLYVIVRVDPLAIRTKAIRAQAIIRRYASGNSIAFIDLESLKDSAEMMAHEIEHVVEYLDGWRLNELAEVTQSGVKSVGEGRYETTRAASAGRNAARELRIAEETADPGRMTPELQTAVRKQR